jgi:hypothetical protein
MLIQTILLYPPGAVWTDGPSNVSRLDPSCAVQVDAEHPARNRQGEGSDLLGPSRRLRSAPGRIEWTIGA